MVGRMIRGEHARPLTRASSNFVGVDKALQVDTSRYEKFLSILSALPVQVDKIILIGKQWMEFPLFLSCVVFGL